MRLIYGVSHTSNAVIRGYSLGFFQATEGENVLAHEIGHSINFTLLGASWKNDQDLQDRFVETGGFRF